MRSTQFFQCWMILASLIFPSQVTLAKETEDNCSVFDWNHKPATSNSQSPRPVSAAKYCPARSDENSKGQNCTLTGNGTMNFLFSDNTTEPEYHPWLADLIERTLSTANVDMPAPHFNRSVNATIEQTKSLQPGQAGFIAFEAAMFCYEGALQKCTGNIKDGSRARICAPLWSKRGDHVVVTGNYSVVTIDKNQVENYPDPYTSTSGGIWSSKIRGDVLAIGLAVSLLAVLAV
ncbi:hypothetical protein N7539_008960 [Penicillium diatomitis]|uniref:Uncharacterized protein n=1 Tax=Penicillium diatomitis TaxID=2819901 RepID=A0A9X0BJK7_9EURO|nr:uncharacterized protein N7539_008960 [Penicillium diatomitis]KAJ5469342.1 hypothetical protein N7539_008960 [Penicillium diatomitis]